MLKVDNLTFEVNEEGRKRCLVNHISFEVKDGEMLVITGPNGGGKSTLAKVLAGIEEANGGEIFLDEENITGYDIDHRANAGIGYAFQQPPRFKGMTVKKMLSLAAGKELTEAESCKLLSAVGLCSADYLNRQMDGTLSGGEMKRLEQENTDRNEKIESDSAALEQAKADRDNASAALSEVQLEAANLKQQDSFLDQNIHRLEEEKNRLLTEKMSLRDGHTDSKNEVEKRLAQIEELKQKIENAGKDAETYYQEMTAAQDEKAAKNEAQKGFFEKREALSARISDLDKELLRLQNQSDKLAERQDAQVEYMWNEYGLTFSTAELLRDGSLDNVADMKRQIAERKNAIRGLGNVNVNAIEDYKEISERYEFMKTQHDDLITAQDALYKIIEELDIGMRKQFTEKFAMIRAEFDKVFRELFGGGHGSLELIEDEDILEAGIQIISQPPGKKLQNMMQMSGGEKALTAIALLFAIQNLKPSPFCLLDEIEAALDDSNVDRYAKYLHKLTKHTQFIVITHRRGTMVAADRLYGITMQEKGVSTLVSVNLIENDLK